MHIYISRVLWMKFVSYNSVSLLLGPSHPPQESQDRAVKSWLTAHWASRLSSGQLVTSVSVIGIKRDSKEVKGQRSEGRWGAWATPVAFLLPVEREEQGWGSERPGSRAKEPRTDRFLHISSCALGYRQVRNAILKRIKVAFINIIDIFGDFH